MGDKSSNQTWNAISDQGALVDAGAGPEEGGVAVIVVQSCQGCGDERLDPCSYLPGIRYTLFSPLHRDHT